MAGPQDVIAKVEGALAAASRFSTNETTQNYDALAQELQDLAELARLSCQSDDHYGALVGKLRAGDPLSPEEMAKVRLLIVGDADYYLKYDEEFGRCKSELAKIVAEIETLKKGELSADALMHLSVLCQEADSLLVPTRHYLDARDRVRRFEESTKTGLDRDSARTLATIIEDMVAQSR
jgi:hypothetical protein